MGQAKQLTRSDDRRAGHASGQVPARKTARHARDRADVDREQTLRALLDDAHERIRMLERTVEWLTAAL